MDIQTRLAYQIDEHFALAANYQLFGTANYRTSSSEIITNPGTTTAATFTVGPQRLSGFLENTFNLNLRYYF